MRRTFGILLLVLQASPLAGQGAGRDWSPSDRTVIGDFTRITSVAAASDRIYATSPTALLVWNPMLRSFEGPYLPPTPDALRRVFAALIDPLDNSLWLGRVDGWVHFDPGARRWDEGTVSAPVQQIAFDFNAPQEGMYLRTSAGWLLVPRGGLSAIPSRAPGHPLSPPSVQDALNANPSLLANSAQILMDRTLAQARYTCAARAFDGLGWYVGTWGVGLLFLSDGAALPQRLVFGLPGNQVGGLYSAPGGVWVATDRTTTAAAALAFVSSDLTEFHWVEGTTGFGMPFNSVLRLLARDTDIWAATDAGLARITTASGDVRLYGQGDGLPDSRVYSVAIRRGVLVAGTAHGLVRLRGDGPVERLAPAYTEPVYAVAVSAATDTAWVGTPYGIRLFVDGQQNLLLPDELRTLAALGEPVVGLQWEADSLVGITQDRLVWRDPATKQWWLGPTLSPLLGRLRSFAVDEGGVWVAGERAIGFARYNAMPTRTFFAPGDLPASPTDLAIDNDYLWVGTTDGMVRFLLNALR